MWMWHRTECYSEILPQTNYSGDRVSAVVESATDRGRPGSDCRLDAVEATIRRASLPVCPTMRTETEKSSRKRTKTRQTFRRRTVFRFRILWPSVKVECWCENGWRWMPTLAACLVWNGWTRTLVLSRFHGSMDRALDGIEAMLKSLRVGRFTQVGLYVFRNRNRKHEISMAPTKAMSLEQAFT